MLNLYNIRFEGQSQGFCVKEYAISPSGDSAVIMTESTRTYKDFCCPECGDKVYVHEPFQVRIKDMPNQPNVPLYIHYSGHRYRCSKCGETFTEEIPFKYPGTRITRRAAEWIRTFLNNKISIRAIQKMTGIHWETIRRIQMEMMEEAIAAREEEKKALDRILGTMKKIGKNSYLVMSPGRMGGEGLELILDYLRMCLHLDIIKFNRMLLQLQQYEDELWDLYRIIGETDACIAVAEYRAFLPETVCPEFRQEKNICARNMYHPLIENAVPNSLNMKKIFY